MRTNCVNCGAAIETSETKCPFCGTSYFDLTSIDFTSREPVFCHLMVPCGNGKALITMYAKPEMNDITHSTDYVDVMSGSTVLTRIPSAENLSVGISLHAFPHANNTLMTVEVQPE